MNKVKKTKKKPVSKKPESKKPKQEQYPPDYLIHHLTTPITIYDYRVNKFTYVNQPFADLTGFTVDDLNSIQFAWFSRIHPRDLTIWKELVLPRINEMSKKHVKNNKQHFSATVCFRFRNKDEQYIQLLTQSDVIEWTNKERAVVLNTFTDITNYKQGAKMFLEISIADESKRNWQTVHREEFTEEPEMLSKREKEIMKLMIDRKSAQEISKILDMNYYTLRSHMRNILIKTKCNSQSELRVLAVAEGWI